MVKILVYAQLCIHNMTCAVSLQLKVPVKLSITLATRFQNFQNFFSVPSQLR